MALGLLSIFIATDVYAERKWNNHENKKRYEEALRQQAEYSRNEAKAWNNYDRELERAQKDVRRVRDEAMKGAVKGGAGGAAWDAAKGSMIGIYERGKDHHKNRKK